MQIKTASRHLPRDPHQQARPRPSEVQDLQAELAPPPRACPARARRAADAHRSPRRSSAAPSKPRCAAGSRLHARTRSVARRSPRRAPQTVRGAVVAAATDGGESTGRSQDRARTRALSAQVLVDAERKAHPLDPMVGRLGALRARPEQDCVGRGLATRTCTGWPPWWSNRSSTPLRQRRTPSIPPRRGKRNGPAGVISRRSSTGLPSPSRRCKRSTAPERSPEQEHVRDRGIAIPRSRTCTCSGLRSGAVERLHRREGEGNPVELRVEVTPAGPFRLPRLGGMDGVLRCRQGCARTIAPPRRRAGARARRSDRSRRSPVRRSRPARESARYGIERMRFALGVDEDLSAF